MNIFQPNVSFAEIKQLFSFSEVFSWCWGFHTRRSGNSFCLNWWDRFIFSRSSFQWLSSMWCSNVVAEQSQTANHSTVVESNEGEGRKFVVKQLLGSDHPQQQRRCNEIESMSKYISCCLNCYFWWVHIVALIWVKLSTEGFLKKKILAGPIPSIFLSSFFWWGNLNLVCVKL